jgi:hypothetical protein
MDHNALMRQVTFKTKVQLDVDTRSLAREDDALHFLVRRPRPRKVIVRLNGRDLYDVTIGHVARPSLERVVDGEERDVHVDDLNPALLRLAGLED